MYFCRIPQVNEVYHFRNPVGYSHLNFKGMPRRATCKQISCSRGEWVDPRGSPVSLVLLFELAHPLWTWTIFWVRNERISFKRSNRIFSLVICKPILCATDYPKLYLRLKRRQRSIVSVGISMQNIQLNLGTL